jgi:hypothetical protein
VPGQSGGSDTVRNAGRREGDAGRGGRGAKASACADAQGSAGAGSSLDELIATGDSRSRRCVRWSSRAVAGGGARGGAGPCRGQSRDGKRLSSAVALAGGVQWPFMCSIRSGRLDISPRSAGEPFDVGHYEAAIPGHDVGRPKRRASSATHHSPARTNDLCTPARRRQTSLPVVALSAALLFWSGRRGAVVLQASHKQAAATTPSCFCLAGT